MTSAALGIRSARGTASVLLAGVALLAGCFSPTGATGSGGASTSTGSATTGGTGTTVAATTAEVTTSAPTTTGSTTTTTGVETSASTTGLTLTGLLTTGATEVTTALTEVTTALTDTTLTTLETTGQPLFCGDGVVQPPEECDDGNATDDDGCSVDCTFEFRYVFVSSQSYAGKEMGGALGGDAKCNALAAANPDLAGRTFAAWLSTGMKDAKDRIGSSTLPYRLTDGFTEVAANTSGLLDDGLDAPIHLDEWGNPAADAQHVWTGTLASGLAAPMHCSGWSNVGVDGWAGLWTEFGIGWTDSAELPCSQLRRIYCIEVPP